MRSDITALTYGGEVIALPQHLHIDRWIDIEDRAGKAGRQILIALLQMHPATVRAVIEVADPSLDFDALASAMPLAALARAAMAPLLVCLWGEPAVTEAAVIRVLNGKRK